MNNNFTYEQLIAQKLEQLDVPDMADAIWSRIKTELDSDMPEDDNNGNNNPSPVSPKSPVSLNQGFGWLAFIVCIAVMMSVNKQSKKEKSEQSTLPLPVKEQPVTPLNNNVLKDVKTGMPKERPGKLPVVIPDKNQASTFRPVEPTVNALPGKDSLQTMPSMQLPPGLNHTPLIKDTGPQKKKGVRGITDDDYRIVPSKDTMH